MATTKHMVKRGFTLIEILIVVVILGILAAIVIPQFTDASQEAMESSVKSQLQTVRSQIELYRVKQGSLPPTALFTNGTDADGLVDLDYLQAAPVNPYNGSSTVAAAAAATVGWVYEADGDFFAVGPAGTIAGGTDGTGNGTPAW